MMASAQAQPGPYEGRRFDRAGPQTPQTPQAPRQDQGTDREQVPHERMTPEQRQQLKRDIDQHGREVYRKRPGEGTGRQPPRR